MVKYYYDNKKSVEVFVQKLKCSSQHQRNSFCAEILTCNKPKLFKRGIAGIIVSLFFRDKHGFFYDMNDIMNNEPFETIIEHIQNGKDSSGDKGSAGGYNKIEFDKVVSIAESIGIL